MKEFAGKEKVLMVAFGHYENVLSLCKAVSQVLPIQLVFVVSGMKMQSGILDIDISTMKFGLNSNAESARFLPKEIRNFVDDDFDIRFVRTPSRQFFKDKSFRNMRIVWKAAKLLKKENYRVVHFNGISSFVLYFRLVFGRSVKSFWTIHDYKHHSGEENPKSLFVQKMNMSLGFEYFQHYKWLRERFMEHYKMSPDKVHQVYSGAFNIYRYFEPKPIKELIDKEYILFFGRISPYKGIDFLVSSFLKYKHNSKDHKTKLCIAGSGNLWFDTHILNHPDIVFINRYILPAELVYMIKNALFVSIPYTDSTHSAVVMCTYAFDKPVVATDVGGLHEVIIRDKTGLLVEKNNEDALAIAFGRLVNNSEKLAAYESNINKLKESGHLNWQSIAEQMHDIYYK